MPKSAEEIEGRRDAKRQVVKQIMDLAYEFPRSALAGMVISHDEVTVGMSFQRIIQWWNGLPNDKKQVFRTAKGCTRRPPETPPFGQNNSGTFREHLQLLEAPEEVGCFGGWLFQAVRWALQVMRENPHAFPDARTDAIARDLQARREVIDAR
jgi:hypothetical protein